MKEQVTSLETCVLATLCLLNFLISSLFSALLIHLTAINLLYCASFASTRNLQTHFTLQIHIATVEFNFENFLSTWLVSLIILLDKRTFAPLWKCLTWIFLSLITNSRSVHASVLFCSTQDNSLFRAPFSNLFFCKRMKWWWWWWWSFGWLFK